jgi:hypothetical protein
MLSAKIAPLSFFQSKADAILEGVVRTVCNALDDIMIAFGLMIVKDEGEKWGIWYIEVAVVVVAGVYECRLWERLNVGRRRGCQLDVRPFGGMMMSSDDDCGSARTANCEKKIVRPSDNKNHNGVHPCHTRSRFVGVAQDFNLGISPLPPMYDSDCGGSAERRWCQ